MIEKTGAFTGHRVVVNRDEIDKKLKETIIGLYNEGYRFFGTGGALGFDTLAALAVLDVKKCYKDIQLILVLPCINQTEKWRYEDIDLYERIKKQLTRLCTPLTTTLPTVCLNGTDILLITAA